MDPTACFHQIAEAFANDDWETVDELCQELASWLDRGGFPPRLTGHQEFDRLVAKNALDALIAWDV